MYDTTDTTERFVMVAVDQGDAGISAEESLDELAELIRTSGGEAVGRLIQKREHIHPGHYVGKGKLLELTDLISLTNATGVVCDDELSGKAQKNLMEALGDDVKVMDRTTIILDIFAQRAVTAEGKLQVELAQLKYSMSHLTGLGKQLSRQGGGIGTRGPGEKKLETDRRHIQTRMHELNRDLAELKTHRQLLREKRKKNAIPVVSLVGYTNAGKSTLLNVLSGAGVLAEDKLFATLDTVMRKVTLPGGSVILLADTVGFIQKLPHHLIQAFRATLEELAHADVLLHVVDAQSPMRQHHIDVVNHTLKDLDCLDKPAITVFNKMDGPVEKPLPVNPAAEKSAQISAISGEGMAQLTQTIEDVLKTLRREVRLLVPYSDGAALNAIYESCEVLSCTHENEGTALVVYAPAAVAQRLEKYMVE